jgi:hypothetical protein
VIRRLFIAHPKTLADAELEDLVEAGRRAFEGKTLRDGTPIELEITTGRESVKIWEATHRGLPFNWQAWQTQITGSSTPFGGEPNYHYIVVGPGARIGRGTAPILNAALRLGRQVLFVDAARKLRPVIAVQEIDGQDWKNGWLAVIS